MAEAEQDAVRAASSSAASANSSDTIEAVSSTQLDDVDANEEADVNSTRFDGLAANEEAEASCVDTPNWDNGWYDCAKESYDPGMCTAADAPTGGWTCAAYVAKGWCRDGRCLGPDETGGVYACGWKLKSPEDNCCACGGGSGMEHAEEGAVRAASSSATSASSSDTIENAVSLTQLDDVDANEEADVNSSRFDGLAANEEAEASCVDTPNWDNGYYDCVKESY